MLIDAADLPNGSSLVAEVCIVGAGPAGLALADALVATGRRVLLIEAGAASPRPRGDDVTSTANVGLPYPLRSSRARGVGGSSLRWDIITPLGAPYVRLRELDELDFEVARGDLPGWPFSKDCLGPYYRRARALFGLHGAAESDRSVEDTLVRRTFEFGPATVFTTELPQRLVASTGCTVVHGAVATDLRADDRPGHVSSLSARTADGRSLSVTAGAYVVAGGGIENPRLLLASRSRHVDGWGNGSGLLGRCFMEHPHYAAGVIVPGRSGLAKGEEEWNLVVQDGVPQQRKYGLDHALVRREGLLNVAAYLAPRPLTRPVVRRAGQVDQSTMQSAHVLRMAALSRRWPQHAGLHTARLAAATPALAAYVVSQATRRRASGVRRREIFTVAYMAEQQPLRSSRIRLVDELDGFGVPKAELDWRIGDLDRLALHRNHELMAPLLGRWFGGCVQSMVQSVDVPHLGSGLHHMGTTRMSASARDGVVDPDCRVHGVDNLFVAGSSVFPTGGCANPTLTIVALALRLADRLVRTGRPPA